MTVLDQSVVEGDDAIAELLAGELGELLGPDMTARWGIRREQYNPRVLLSGNESGITAAALLSNRPATAALKIVDLWCAEQSAAAAMLDAITAMAQAQGAIVVKWELHGNAQLPEAGHTRGFAPMQPKGHGGDTGTVRGYALWLTPIPHTELRYYPQSTEFTCGAVAALLATENDGHGFTGDSGDRRLELDFWRTASNFPACEPIGLAVAIKRQRPGDQHVEVALDTDTPILLDDFTGFEREFRVELQEDSRQHAVDLAIPLRTDRIEVTEIAARIAGDDIALLLITQAPMHGHAEPHWITAHASDGRSVVLVQDPWLDRPGGETWVDAHDLPIRLDDLDRLCRWGPQQHRGVVFLARR